MLSIEDIQAAIKQIISDEMGTPTHTIGTSQSFYDLGLDSVNSIFLLAKLENELSVYIDPLSLFDNPTIESFSNYVYQQLNGGS
ncbi:MAG: hypothetical protein Tsb0034_05520 [Ekhidna sp.]